MTLPTATPAGILVVGFATVVPDLKAAHLNSAEREGQPVIVHIIKETKNERNCNLVASYWRQG